MTWLYRALFGHYGNLDFGFFKILFTFQKSGFVQVVATGRFWSLHSSRRVLVSHIIQEPGLFYFT